MSKHENEYPLSANSHSQHNPDPQQHIVLNESGQTSPQRMMKNISRGKSLEWGAVNFFVENNSHKGMGNDLGSQSSHSGSCGSLILSMQPNGLGNLQSSMSLEPISSLNLKDEDAIKKFMTEYDRNVFSSPSKLQHDSTKRGSPSTILPSLCTSGIEAALEHYEDPKRNDESDSNDPPGLVKTVSIKDNSVIIPEKSLAVSPLGLMPYSFDGRKSQIRPSAMRLVLPEALPGLGSRRKSFSVLHDSLRSADHGGSTTSKTPKHHKLIGLPSLQQTFTPSKKQVDRGDKSQLHQHSARRRGRKQWVLNPFRQEDEDEVLAKRTHNRRRWSHVFPLGEEVSYLSFALYYTLAPFRAYTNMNNSSRMLIFYLIAGV
jgi:hypothetical protein